MLKENEEVICPKIKKNVSVSPHFTSLKSAIIERIREYGVPIDLVCCGGIVEKNPLLTQIYANVTGCTMYLADSSQACALGSAISAVVLAGSRKGGHGDFHSAQQAMTSLKPVSYSPEPENQAIYNQLYALYRKLHDAFGGISKCIDLSGVMKELMRIKEEAGTLLASRGQNP